jgi:hypothetical protein
MAKSFPSSPYTAGEPDEVVGPPPDVAAPTQSEWDEMRQALAELRRANADALAREERMRAELAENQAIVQRMLNEGNSLDLVAIEAKRRNREAARRRIYKFVEGKKVVIQLHTQEDPRKNYPVHVNVNGNYHNIPRGRPYEIGGEFLEALDHAYVDHITKEVDESGNPRLVHYDLFSYPYQVLRGLEGMPSGDILDAAT